MLMLRKMPLTFGSAIRIVLIFAVSIMDLCTMVHPAPDSSEYIHYGCFYEVYSCASAPYYIDMQRPNVSIFDVCLELAKKKGVKHFGVQAMQKTDCITGPNFLKPQRADCLKRTMCNQDQSKLSSYSYDLYVIKDVNECSNYTVLNTRDRAQGVPRGDLLKCDKNDLIKGWYRFSGEAGSAMPTSCVPKDRCGTAGPGWMEGSHPTQAQGIVSRKVCFHWYNDCCQFHIMIRVRNCGDFYVYELDKTPGCYLRYCGNAGGDTSLKIVRSPVNQTANEKGTVEIRCDFEGNPFPVLSWLKNDQYFDIILHYDRITNTITRRGNTSGIALLRISRLEIDDEGYYKCRVENKMGVATTQGGYLKITFLHDVIISTPKPYTLTLGQKNLSLQCSVLGSPLPILSWYKERTPVSQIQSIRTMTYNVSSKQVNSELLLTASDAGVSYNESGNYTCVAYSRTLNKTTRGTVEVLFKPEIQRKPTDQTVIQGTQASFYCNATGVPEPVILWRFSGGSTPKHTGNKIVIDSVQNTKEYEGRYTCIASSRAGRAEESASLTVLVPPTRKAALPQGVILQLGQTLRLKCDVYGDPEPSFEWTKRLPGQTEGIILPNQKKAELVIPDVRLKDAAYYGCSATSRLGVVKLDDELVDIDTSLEIINGGEHFTAVAGNNMTIKCVASSEITPQVRMLKNGIELQTEAKVSEDKKVVIAELNIKSVTTDDSGFYTCVATNRQKSVKADVRLVVDVPIKIDMDVTLQDQTFTEELNNNASEKYQNLSTTFVEELTKIYINETGFVRVEVLSFSNGSVAVRFRVIFKVKVEKPEDKPPPDTKVRISNVVVRRVKESQGVVGTLRIKPDSIKPLVKPPSPRNLTAINIKKSELSIEWKHPLFHDSYAVKQYVIKYKEFGKSWKKIEVDGKQVNTYFLEDLETGTKYSIQTHAVNHLGEGLPSNVVETETLSAFWGTFAKVFIPLLIIIIIIVIIVLLYLRRRRRLRRKRSPDVTDNNRHKELLIRGKKINEEEDILETIELPKRWKEIPRENIELGKELGSGQFGVVYKGFLKEKGEDEDVPCAVKMLKPNATQEATRDLFNELEIMASVDEHPNIVNLLGACTVKDGPMYVVVEFAENGCLLEYLRANRMTFPSANGNLEEVSSLKNQEKIRLGCQVATGMQHLAKLMCVHRDLAARNVLLGKDRIAKVADFGLARDVYEQGFYERSSIGGKLPAKWMSIEALETFKATTESDVWSFGVLLWEIETGGKMPFSAFSFNEILKALKSGVRLQQPAKCINEVYSIMRTCWEADPRKRPTFGDLSWKLDNLFIHYLED